MEDSNKLSTLETLEIADHFMVKSDNFIVEITIIGKHLLKKC